MAFVVPQMPILIDIWDWDADPNMDAPRIADVAANLVPGFRQWGVSRPDVDDPEDQFLVARSLLLPYRTDIRGPECFGGDPGKGDRLRVPKDTLRFYRVLAVDDYGRGFANEHRVAIITSDPDIPWGFPIE